MSKGYILCFYFLNKEGKEKRYILKTKKDGNSIPEIFTTEKEAREYLESHRKDIASNLIVSFVEDSNFLDEKDKVSVCLSEDFVVDLLDNISSIEEEKNG